MLAQLGNEWEAYPGSIKAVESQIRLEQSKDHLIHVLPNINYLNARELEKQ